MLNFIEGLYLVYKLWGKWRWLFWVPAICFAVLALAGAGLTIVWKEATQAFFEAAWWKMLMANRIFLGIMTLAAIFFFVIQRQKPSTIVPNIILASMVLWASISVLMAGIMFYWYQNWIWLKTMQAAGALEVVGGVSSYLMILAAIILYKWKPISTGSTDISNLTIQVEEPKKK
jgi:hypothetical protein